MFGTLPKLESPWRLVQFWQNFQTSLVLLIPNCTRRRMITYTNCVHPNPPSQLSLWKETGAPGENLRISAER
jgi:hypothetical protein